MNHHSENPTSALLKKEAIWFLVICFAATYGLNAAVYLLAGR